VDGLTVLRQLAASDDELGAEGERLRALAEEVERVRAGADAVESFFAHYTEEESRRRAESAAAREHAARRAEEARAAAAQLEAATGDEQRAAAERAAARANDRVAIAEARVARAEGAERELEREAGVHQEEIPALEETARRVSHELPELPAKPKGPRELLDWASRARATLFVAEGGIATQRERLIREANELGTMLLGEPTYGSTAAQVRARVEATIGRAPS
jgi:hypothetical protein